MSIKNLMTCGICLVLAGMTTPAAAQFGAKEIFGGIAGGVIGGALGKKGGNPGKIVGAIIGASIGVIIAKELSSAHRKQLNTEQRAAVRSNLGATSKGTWKSDDGTKTATFVAKPPQPKAAFEQDKTWTNNPKLADSKLPSSTICREVETDLNAGGKKGSGKSLWCRNAAGDWDEVAPLTS